MPLEPQSKVLCCKANALASVSVPPLTVLRPLKRFAPASTSVPGPNWVTLPVPPMAVCIRLLVPERLKASVALSVTVVLAMPAAGPAVADLQRAGGNVVPPL